MIGIKQTKARGDPQPMDPFCNQEEMGLFTFYQQQHPSPPFPCPLNQQLCSPISLSVYGPSQQSTGLKPLKKHSDIVQKIHTEPSSFNTSGKSREYLARWKHKNAKIRNNVGHVVQLGFCPPSIPKRKNEKVQEANSEQKKTLLTCFNPSSQHSFTQMHLTSLTEATAQQVRDLFRPKQQLRDLFRPKQQLIPFSCLSDQPSLLKKDRPLLINPEEIHPFEVFDEGRALRNSMEKKKMSFSSYLSRQKNMMVEHFSKRRHQRRKIEKHMLQQKGEQGREKRLKTNRSIRLNFPVQK